MGTSDEHRDWVVEIADEQSALNVDPSRMRLAVEHVLAAASIGKAEISVAVVDDPTIHELNRTYLQHDYPTDVLSFVLERSDEHLEGQIVVSTETAQSEAARYGWTAEDELLLYVIHGSLHLVGYDDTTDESRAEMRRMERRMLAHFGLTPPAEPKPSPDRDNTEQ